MATTTEKDTTTKTSTEVTIAALAATLNTDARTLRGFVRGMKLGCGRGARYAWPSMNDADVKKIVRAWSDAQKTSANDGKGD